MKIRIETNNYVNFAMAILEKANTSSCKCGHVIAGYDHSALNLKIVTGQDLPDSNKMLKRNKKVVLNVAQFIYFASELIKIY